MKLFLEKKKREGFSILGLEQTANSVPLDQFEFPKKTVSMNVFLMCYYKFYNFQQIVYFIFVKVKTLSTYL